MTIVIASAREAISLVDASPGTFRVVSILGLEILLNNLPLENAKQSLKLRFSDMTKEDYDKVSNTKSEIRLATLQDCEKALEFLEVGGDRIVHCHAGISRSSAVTLGYFLTEYKDYREAVRETFRIRPIARPNLYVLKLMCEVVGRQSEYESIVAYIQDYRVSFG